MRQLGRGPERRREGKVVCKRGQTAAVLLLGLQNEWCEGMGGRGWRGRRMTERGAAHDDVQGERESGRGGCVT